LPFYSLQITTVAKESADATLAAVEQRVKAIESQTNDAAIEFMAQLDKANADLEAATSMLDSIKNENQQKLKSLQTRIQAQKEEADQFRRNWKRSKQAKASKSVSVGYRLTPRAFPPTLSDEHCSPTPPSDLLR